MKLKPKHQQPLPYDSTCVAARTRPLVSCRRRRLIQPNTVPNLNGKVSWTVCVCRLVHACILNCIQPMKSFNTLTLKELGECGCINVLDAEISVVRM